MHWLMRPLIIFAFFVFIFGILIFLLKSDRVVGHHGLRDDHIKIMNKMSDDREIILAKLRGKAFDDGSYATINDLHSEHQNMWVKMMKQEHLLNEINRKLDLILNTATNATSIILDTRERIPAQNFEPL